MRLFVYGSLKTGECNFNQVQPYFVEARAAKGPGRMLLRPDGYPALVVDSSFILDVGSDDLERDMGRAGDPAPPVEAEVSGQLMLLHSGAEITERLDIFEGYFPGRPSEYLRVLIPVNTEEGWECAWVYVAAHPDPAWPAIAQWPCLPAQPPPYRYELGWEKTEE